MSEQGAISVVFLDAAVPAFEAWLDQRGLRLFLMPPDAQDEDDLPVYGIGPKVWPQ